MNKPNSYDDANKLINDLLHDIEVCKETLEMSKAVPENILPQLRELNEQLKRAIQAAENIRKELA